MSENFWPTICFIVIAAVAFGWLWRFGFKNTYFNLWVTFKIRCVIVPLYKLAVKGFNYSLIRRGRMAFYSFCVFYWVKTRLERRFIKRYGVSLQYSLLSNE